MEHLLTLSGRSWGEVFFDIQKIQEMDGQGRERGNKGTKEGVNKGAKKGGNKGTKKGGNKRRKD